MVRRGVVINLNNYQSERLDIEFPIHLLPPDCTTPEAAEAYAFRWVQTALIRRVAEIVRREAGKGQVPGEFYHP